MTSIPKPVPRPGTLAGAKPATVAPIVTATPVSDPTQWGRVEEDGSAYVTTAHGDRLIGSWQAGTPAEGLAHYGARYDDLATEVAYLENRLVSHPNEASHIKTKANELFASLADAAVIGDLAALEDRLKSTIANADEVGHKAKEEKARRREENIKRKEALALEAEDLAEKSTDWKQAGDRIREILDEWKTIRGIDRKTDDALWKRYSRARDSFNRRRGAHFAELDRGRAAARRVKEDLVARAEELKDSTDWGETARAFRDLMKEWKSAGRAPRDVDDKLWEAFKSAQDHFFEARNAQAHERDVEFEHNAQAKQELLDQYDALINPENGLDKARAHLRELQEKWEAIGFVPRDRVREFEQKIGKLEKRVTQAADEQWRRTDPAAQARAAQFSAKVTELNAQATAAEEKGQAKKAQSLREQAQQWQEWADAALSAVENR
ncbi:DUF349 domain-containing protein [Corynebacterium sp. ES2794-CONJ1]|uniref:DUF349 domain-containing protein n=1 Tax=unclassified Corynebacterium TaxID=2624378 RepID=UPI002169B18F|nr:MULTISPECIES: DUF349 domain-containing protein [unclassified Corynebacterium]MCS4489162.1 DUF349 domain-containing protein [Corynebacterium sp. ES2775-CONJ]MCS4490976.1 DUF349 domain-containing protein [Corynebacterium sp. ES2715-CONJ3]MCS4531144.1 DUF349 domain-containing protein [Corynebacterium sp. ES2730-CONJ]MCU9518511.1 DUF349 domain-containing protein [Corynebacterium sp. ES2794-CONJ1]